MTRDMWRGRPPKPATILGAMGLFPFLTLGAIAAFGPSAVSLDASVALVAYGASILSFLGGAHWGYCIAGAARSSRSNSLRLAAGVTPSLVAWLALLLPATSGLITLAVALSAMLAFDVWSARRGWAPTWYPALRWPLSIGAVSASLLAAAQ